MLPNLFTHTHSQCQTQRGKKYFQNKILEIVVRVEFLSFRNCSRCWAQRLRPARLPGARPSGEGPPDPVSARRDALLDSSGRPARRRSWQRPEYCRQSLHTPMLHASPHWFASSSASSGSTFPFPRRYLLRCPLSSSPPARRTCGRCSGYQEHAVHR